MARKVAATLTVEDFKYLDELGFPLPQLILGIEVDRSRLTGEQLDYKFKPGRQWHKIAHQTAGHACAQHYIVGTLLKPKTPQIQKGIAALNDKWLDSDAGVFGVSLEEVLTYRQDLKTLFGADCNQSYSKFEEGFYPLDLEFLPKLAADSLDVEKLDDMVEWPSGFARMCGMVGRWSLLIAGENGD